MKPTPPGGAPVRAGSPQRSRFLVALEERCDVAAAAAAAGVTERAAHTWRRDDPAFRAAWEQAVANACARIEGRLLARAESELGPAGTEGAPAVDSGRLLALLKHLRSTLTPQPEEAKEEARFEDVAAALVARLRAVVEAPDGGA